MLWANQFEEKSMIYEIKKCIPSDAHYPKALNDISKKPDCLYYIGDIDILNNKKSVAIIGSRDCSDEGRKLAYNAGIMAAEMGYVIVNGLAYGCDTEALLGALDKNGKCAVFLPGGLNSIYPKQNEKLAERIVETGGCIISEYVSYMKPQKYTFVERDRLQSGVSQGVIVIETTENGGTMHTVEFALRQYRRLAAYSALLVNNASGNAIIERKKEAFIIKDNDSLLEFYKNLPERDENKQLSMFNDD